MKLNDKRIHSFFLFLMIAAVVIAAIIHFSVKATVVSDPDITGQGGGGTGTVTSVDATVPPFLAISGNPITTTGTLAFTLSGTALPVASGGTGQTTTTNAINALVPTQAGNSGEFLTTDGSVVSWAAAGGGGANTTLSNLGVTNINANFTFNTGAAATIKTRDEATGTSKFLTVKTGDATTGTGGNANFGSGDGYGGTGGDTTLFSGYGSTGGGDVSLYAAGADANFNTGRIEAFTEEAAGSGNSGDIEFIIGNVDSGTRGSFKFLKDGVPSVVGQVWTATGVDGSGYWAAAGGVPSPLQITGTYSATTPRYSFSDDTDTGMDAVGGSLYFINGGQARLAIAGNAILAGGGSTTLGLSGALFLGTYSSRVFTGLGTAALPSYTFDADPNTGIYSSAANTLDLSTDGVRKLSIETSGHMVTSGTDPTITANCGTSPSVVGDDVNGRITVGTGGVATSCTLTFATAWTAAPSCVANDESTLLFVQSTASTTTLVVTATTPLGAGDLINYHCEGYQ